MLMYLENLKSYSLLSFLNHPHQSKIFIYLSSDPKEKFDLALKAVMVKYKYIFCPFCAQHVWSHFSSQLEEPRSLFHNTCLSSCLKFSCDSTRQEKDYFKADTLNSA